MHKTRKRGEASITEVHMAVVEVEAEPQIGSADTNAPTVETDHAARVEIESGIAETVMVDTLHHGTTGAGALPVGDGETRTNVVQDK